MKIYETDFTFNINNCNVSAFCSFGCYTNEGNIEWADLDVADINLNYAGGVMHITGASGQVVRIYNVAGVTIKTFRIEGNDKRVNLPLADGIYVVKVGNTFTRKICVKH